MYANRRRIRGDRGKGLLRRRGEKVERQFAHGFETGGLRRVHLRGHSNIEKRLLVHYAGFNLGLLMRQLVGVGTPRGLQGRSLAALWALFVFSCLSGRLQRVSDPIRTFLRAIFGVPSQSVALAAI